MSKMSKFESCFLVYVLILFVIGWYIDLHEWLFDFNLWGMVLLPIVGGAIGYPILKKLCKGKDEK